MPRKAFIADIQASIDKNIPAITAITRGNDDNEVIACFVPQTGSSLEISMLAQPGT